MKQNVIQLIDEVQKLNIELENTTSEHNMIVQYSVIICDVYISVEFGTYEVWSNIDEDKETVLDFDIQETITEIKEETEKFIENVYRHKKENRE